MKPEEHTAILQDIRKNLTDEAKVTELLTKLTDDYNSVSASTEAAIKKADELTQHNEKLRASNMDLFLRLGTPADKTKDKNPDEPQKKKFEDLIDEKGRIK